MTDLSKTMDAKVWATEFLFLYNTGKVRLDADTMTGWFANAILVGYDNARQAASVFGAQPKALSASVTVSVAIGQIWRNRKTNKMCQVVEVSNGYRRHIVRYKDGTRVRSVSALYFSKHHERMS